MPRFVATLIFLALSTFSSPVYAFYCDNYIIGEKDTAARVLARCGEPATATSWTEEESRGTQIYAGAPIRTRYGKIVLAQGSMQQQSIIHTVEEWVYNFGPSRFMYIVRFKDGRIVKIDRDGYGY